MIFSMRSRPNGKLLHSSPCLFVRVPSLLAIILFFLSLCLLSLCLLSLSFQSVHLAIIHSVFLSIYNYNSKYLSVYPSFLLSIYHFSNNHIVYTIHTYYVHTYIHTSIHTDGWTKLSVEIARASESNDHLYQLQKLCRLFFYPKKIIEYFYRKGIILVFTKLFTILALFLHCHIKDNTKLSEFIIFVQKTKLK